MSPNSLALSNRSMWTTPRQWALASQAGPAPLLPNPQPLPTSRSPPSHTQDQALPFPRVPLPEGPSPQMSRRVRAPYVLYFPAPLTASFASPLPWCVRQMRLPPPVGIRAAWPASLVLPHSQYGTAVPTTYRPARSVVLLQPGLLGRFCIPSFCRRSIRVLLVTPLVRRQLRGARP